MLTAGGALLRPRIGAGHNYQAYGVQEHVTGNVRFEAIYTFGAADPAILRHHYFYQVATLPMGSNPYTPATSDRRYVLAGGHPPPLPHRHRRKRRR